MVMLPVFGLGPGPRVLGLSPAHIGLPDHWGVFSLSLCPSPMLTCSLSNKILKKKKNHFSSLFFFFSKILFI
ncbi:hypothetical protein GH733_013350 [Mirounga leonina]|nr:hypothetical protein GH733_013350 [Mirounga leonina]